MGILWYTTIICTREKSGLKSLPDIFRSLGMQVSSHTILV